MDVSFIKRGFQSGLPLQIVASSKGFLYKDRFLVRRCFIEASNEDLLCK